MGFTVANSDSRVAEGRISDYHVSVMFVLATATQSCHLPEVVARVFVRQNSLLQQVEHWILDFHLKNVPLRDVCSKTTAFGPRTRT
jgi:hypothetical protein